MILVQGWADLLQEVTDGQITITSYPNETLLKAAKFMTVTNGILIWFIVSLI